ncbi:MAG: hypothetical protein ACREX3_03070 [Gammaproteobacteria bacterium]
MGDGCHDGRAVSPLDDLLNGDRHLPCNHLPDRLAECASVLAVFGEASGSLVIGRNVPVRLGSPSRKIGAQVVAGDLPGTWVAAARCEECKRSDGRDCRTSIRQYGQRHCRLRPSALQRPRGRLYRITESP